MEFVRYYTVNIKKYDMPLFLKTKVDIELIKSTHPDHDRLTAFRKAWKNRASRMLQSETVFNPAE
jgi:hypothetical protein